ncbi:hypothetical protein [Streptomyces uncialis]|uniref:hypothetical protein n=1 Tax=Streptomyces uncialis TaxID=1048205 RepID=UPI002E30015D|nr:hypothetical protein [Streptomyces uncialis]
MDQSTGEPCGLPMGPDGGVRAVRLLPWITDAGKPCYLVSDASGPGGGRHSVMAKVADNLERMQLGHAAALVERADDMIADHKADKRELRFLANQLRTSLREVTRIADSRGARLATEEGPGDDEPGEGEVCDQGPDCGVCADEGG